MRKSHRSRPNPNRNNFICFERVLQPFSGVSFSVFRTLKQKILSSVYRRLQPRCDFLPIENFKDVSKNFLLRTRSLRREDDNSFGRESSAQKHLLPFFSKNFFLKERNVNLNFLF